MQDRENLIVVLFFLKKAEYLKILLLKECFLDEDEVAAVDKDIKLREYQKELAKEGCEGENVIVMAPTNTGKTRVAWSIIQVHSLMSVVS